LILGQIRNGGQALPFRPKRPAFAAMNSGAAGSRHLANWAGNYSYGTEQLCFASSVEDVRHLVRKNPRLKVLGSRHCFNGIADSKDLLLSLDRLNRVIALDAQARTATVEAGMTYGQLSPYLQANGYALHNLASLPHISVVGACATATHGSGMRNGNLSTAVAAFEIVTADGEVRHCSRAKDGSRFGGMVVHLGALGVLTKITLNLEPTFLMRQEVYLDLPLQRLENHFETIMAAGYSVSLFTDWQKSRINQVWIKRRAEGVPNLDASADFYGAAPAAADVHPLPGLSAENCTEQRGVVGPWHERLPHFRMGFTPSSGQELQSEYFVPLQNAVEAIFAIERLREQVTPHLQVSELRTVASDPLWMSMVYDRPSLGIHFTWKPDWESVRRVLPLIEEALAPFGARPHWAKLFTMAPAVLRAQYGKLAEFRQLVGEFDPQGKFRNEFLGTVLGD